MSRSSNRNSGDSQEVSNSLEGVIKYYSKELQKCINKSLVYDACRESVRSMRLHMYHSILRDACRECFRATNITEKGSTFLCDVWGFNGTVWEKLSPVVFADCIGKAMITVADIGRVIVTEDWVSKKNQMVNDAYAGVCTSPLELDGSIVGFSNGIWDFSDIGHPVLIPFEDRPCITELLPYDYNPDATCPMWLSFINTMLPKKDVYRLQKYLGLGVVNRRLMGRSIEDTLWLIGSGANGKSTIAKVLSLVYGENNISWLSMRELLDRNPMSRQMTLGHIDGKIFNICEEADMNDITRDSDSFKKLCSGAPQSGRDIGRNVREIKDIPFLIFMMNSRPHNKRMDAAFRRRLVDIVFKVSVKEEDMDAGLVDRLESELSGIRNWMIDGYKALVADGYQFDRSSSEEYMEENEQFFDIFAKAEGIRPSAWAGHNERAQLVSAQALLERYDDYCMRKHLCSYHPTMKSMAADLKRLQFQKAPRKATGVYYEVYCDHLLEYAITM